MIWFYGITTIINQAILLRELANLFQSNELTISILFFSWFTGTSLGSSLFRYFPSFIKKTHRPTSVLLFALNILLLVFIVLIRFLYSFFQYHSVPNLFYLSAIFFIFAFPVSFLTGAGLASFLKEYKKSLSYVYFIEGVAAALGGIIFTFVVVGHFDAIFVALTFIFISILFFITGSHINIYKLILILGISILVLICSPYIVKFSRDLEWRQNTKLITSIESRYGYIAEVENNGLTTIYYNGMALSYSGFQTWYEESANLPLLVHANSKSVCIIGFAAPAFLEEIMKYKPDKITILLTDEILAGMIKDSAKNRGIPVDLIIKDPISAVYEIKEKYDLVFVKIGSPTTIANDVFYSDFFYKRLSMLLTQEGIVVLNVPYEENNLSSYSLKNLRIIMGTLSCVFPFAAIAPAESFYFFASNKSIQPLGDKILRNLAKRDLNLKYMNGAYFAHYFDKERVEEYSKLLRNCDAPEINSLFSLKIYNNNLKKWITNNLNDSWVVLVIVLLVCLYFLKRYFNAISNYLLFSRNSASMFTIGLVTIAGEIMLLNYYQIVSGYLYYLYGLLTALFMLGLGIGGFLRYSRKNNGYLNLSFLLLLLWLIGIEILYFVTSFGVLEKISYINILVFVWNFYGGFALGFLFNTFTVVRECFGASGEVTVSELYSFDLLGSALGALLTGPLLLPLLGHSMANLIMSVLLFVVMVYAREK